MDEKQHAERIAAAISTTVQLRQKQGADPETICQEIEALGKAAGTPIRAVMVEVLPGLRAMQVDVGGAAIAANAASQAPGPLVDDLGRPCPYPHVPCPACQASVCFRGQKPKSKQGVCSHCAAFLHCSDDPMSATLMTEEEVAALSDEERIALQKARRMVELDNPRSPRA